MGYRSFKKKEKDELVIYKDNQFVKRMDSLKFLVLKLGLMRLKIQSKFLFKQSLG